jgi:hypothetical protein
MRTSELLVLCIQDFDDDPNFRYSTTIKRPKDVPQLEVNTRKCEWTYKRETHKIGGNRGFNGALPGEPIGVYNPRISEQINGMISLAQIGARKND